MERALDLAERGWGQTAPNPMVGAVIYDGDELVGEGYHARYGDAHAEAVALAQAGARAKGATMYVTLEPCTHHGKTPPCADAVIASGVARVVVASLDANPSAAGGVQLLRSRGVTVDTGVHERRARELNAAFFHSHSSDKPFITLKLALSLDGSISSARRTRGWLTNERSRAMVQRMRANNDAVAIGVQTAIADDPQLTARTDPPPRVPPVRVVFDRTARLPATAGLARSARETPTLLVTASGNSVPRELAALGVEGISAHDNAEALTKLRERGIASMLVEGGAGLAASFLAGGFVDRLVIFRAPLILGDGSLNAFAGIAGHDVEHAPRFRLLESAPVGDDVMTVYEPAR
jgi:diaminohydroxyphosphoribosylaminopyrimidine deaminase/5-amino-6-(5-phosphoribosylamino)uracil reductase